MKKYVLLSLILIRATRLFSMEPPEQKRPVTKELKKKKRKGDAAAAHPQSITAGDERELVFVPNNSDPDSDFQQFQWYCENVSVDELERWDTKEIVCQETEAIKQRFEIYCSNSPAAVARIEHALMADPTIIQKLNIYRWQELGEYMNNNSPEFIQFCAQYIFKDMRHVFPYCIALIKEDGLPLQKIKQVLEDNWKGLAGIISVGMVDIGKLFIERMGKKTHQS